MKLPIAFSITAMTIGMVVTGLADPLPGTGAPNYSTRTTGLGTNSANASGAAPAATPDEGKTDENDDTLYRGKTSESENPMLRDEGPLHFKTRPKEKIQEVDSLKNLQSSGSDPKFQGSLLNSGVTSIDRISKKASDALESANDSDPHFKTKRLTFTPVKNDEPKKTEADSTPSPTPSPTPSLSAKDSRPKQ